jgi:YHS domain-containing protein
MDQNMRASRFLNLVGVFAALFMTAGAAVAGKTASQAKPQSTCPVTGTPIDKGVSTTYGGQKVFFCCAMCIKDFQADPAKYLPLLGRAKAPADAGMHQDEAAPNNNEHEGPGHGSVTRTNTDGS